LAITGQIENAEKVGIVFGREDVGLTNDEMQFCDTLITIPTISHFSSLNLAQAVNIICYELALKNGDAHDTAPPESWMETKRKEPLATRGDLDAYLNRLNTALDERNFHRHGSLRLSRDAALRNIYQRVIVNSSL
jgi:tRNA C32,U32 (ribose-2'-O)-methylase TrmJ